MRERKGNKSRGICFNAELWRLQRIADRCVTPRTSRLCGESKSNGIKKFEISLCKLAVILFFSSLSTSCVIRNHYGNIDELNNENIRVLNGVYSNVTQPSHYPSLADFLIVDHFLRYLDIEIADSSKEVALHLVDSKHLEVKVFIGDSLQSSHIVKGKLKNGFFQLKNQRHHDPEFVWEGLVYTITRQKTSIGVDTLGNLILSSSLKVSGKILHIPIGVRKETYHNVFFKRRSKYLKGPLLSCNLLQHLSATQRTSRLCGELTICEI